MDPYILDENNSCWIILTGRFTNKHTSMKSLWDIKNKIYLQLEFAVILEAFVSLSLYFIACHSTLKKHKSRICVASFYGLVWFWMIFYKFFVVMYVTVWSGLIENNRSSSGCGIPPSEMERLSEGSFIKMRLRLEPWCVLIFINIIKL